MPRCDFHLTNRLASALAFYASGDVDGHLSAIAFVTDLKRPWRRSWMTLS